MTYPEAKRAVRESLMRGIIRNLPQPWPLSMPAAKPNLAQPIDESGFSQDSKWEINPACSIVSRSEYHE